MLSSFEKDIIKEINKFRCNPKSIQHLCEILYKDFQRINSNSPFLQEAESFIKQLESMEPLPELIYNEELSEGAKKELPNFRERKNYQNFKQGNSLKGIVPDHYLITSPLLVAIYKFEENSDVLLKTLLNKDDKEKKGRTILCDSKYTQMILNILKLELHMKNTKMKIR